MFTLSAKNIGELKAVLSLQIILSFLLTPLLSFTSIPEKAPMAIKYFMFGFGVLVFFHILAELLLYSRLNRLLQFHKLLQLDTVTFHFMYFLFPLGGDWGEWEVQIYLHLKKSKCSLTNQHVRIIRNLPEKKIS